MFDLITAGDRRPFHDHAVAPRVVSVIGHGILVLAIVTIPMLYATAQLPSVPTMMAFVPAPVAPPPPPPPPPPAPRARAADKPRPVGTAGPDAAPIEAPSEIRPEPLVEAVDENIGVEGGVEGGMPGGIVGGIVGGLIGVAAPPPPPPPPPPIPPAPVRIGGQIIAPALVHRVEPTYPQMAVLAKVTGTVILEATVDVDGRVESVRILRSIKLLDAAAMEAVRQWRYSPLVLNGKSTPFILTVTLSFSIK